MSNNHNTINNDTMATLDLHGFRLEAAMRRLVEFLEGNQKRKDNTTVCVITGTGQHSHDGPVLRTRVEQFLRERSFVFRYQTGSFFIQCRTGTLTYRRQASDIDSKLVLTTDEIHSKPIRASQVIASNTDETTNNTQQQQQVFCFGPSLQEVARHEHELSTAVEASRISVRQRQQQAAKEHSLLQRAMQESQQEQRERETEQQLLLQALQVSKKENNVKQQWDEQEEQYLQRVIQQSQHDNDDDDKSASKLIQEEEEEQMLEQAIQLSTIDTCRVDVLNGQEEEDDDDGLQRALRLSQLPQQQDDNDWMLEQALQNSLSELNIATCKDGPAAASSSLSFSLVDHMTAPLLQARPDGTQDETAPSTT